MNKDQGSLNDSLEMDRQALELLDDIIDYGQELNSEINIPTRTEHLETNKIVLDFIKKKKLIIYGGTAIDMVLKNAGNQGIYGPDAIPDYDFFSGDSYGDSIELANLLHDKGYQYVERLSAIHKNTYRIRVNFNPETVADLSFIPQDLLDTLPFVEIDGVRYIHPEYMYTDMFRVMGDVAAMYRWDKDIVRFNILRSVFPIPYHSLRKVKNKNEKLREEMVKFIVEEHPNTVFTGIVAFNSYMRKAGEELKDLELIEVMSEDFKSLKNSINKKFKGLKTEHRSYILDIFTDHYIIYKDNDPLILIYGGLENVGKQRYHISYNTFDTNNVDGHNVSSVPHLLYYMNFNVFIQKYFGRTRLSKLYQNMINKLFDTAVSWNKIEGLSGSEPDSLFRLIARFVYDPYLELPYINNVKRLKGGIPFENYRPERDRDKIFKKKYERLKGSVLTPSITEPDVTTNAERTFKTNELIYRREYVSPN